MGSGASAQNDKVLVSPIPVEETVFEVSAIAGNYSFDSYDGPTHRSRSSSSPTNKDLPTSGYFGAKDWLGRKHGYGVMKFDNADTYYGEWHEGVMEGNGTYKYENGDIYTGVFKANKRHGHGLMKYKVGGHYDGEWQEDLKEGFGVERNADGTEYSGTFEKDLPTGQGTVRSEKMVRQLSKGEEAIESTKRSRLEVLLDFDPESMDL